MPMAPTSAFRGLPFLLPDRRRRPSASPSTLPPAPPPPMPAAIAKASRSSSTDAGGAFEDSYVLSLRTDYAFGKAYPLIERVLGDEGSFGGHGHIAGGRIALEDAGESSVRAVERRLRTRALELLGAASEDGIPEEGRAVHE